MKSSTMATLVGLGTLAIGSAASAALITFVAEGNITTLSDPGNLTGGATTWSWTYTFDSDAVDQDPGNPNIGIYDLGDWDLTLGTLTLSSSGNNIRITDDDGGFLDQYEVAGAPPAGWFFAFGPSFLFSNVDGTPFTSDALPLTPPNPADFTNSNLFQLSAISPAGDSLGVEGFVKTIVPAPGALALLGLAGLWRVRRRR